MDYKFEAQAFLVAALKATTSFTSVTNIYDTPSDNQGYPYVAVTACNELTTNRHRLPGSTILITFSIYTKPGMLGTYERDNIHGIMKTILNNKRFSSTSSMYMTNSVYMAGCMFYSSNSFEEGEIQGINTTYKVVVCDDTPVTW